VKPGHRCSHCGKTFYTAQGLGQHFAWLRRRRERAVRPSRDFRKLTSRLLGLVTELIGWAELQRRAQPGECPLCGDPLAGSEGKRRKPVTCGDEVCRKAWHRYWRRDQRALLRLESEGALKIPTRRHPND